MAATARRRVNACSDWCLWGLRWFVAAALLTGGPAAFAADYHWVGAGTGGNTATDPSDPTTLWLTPANWQEENPPGASDTARLALWNDGAVNAQTASIKDMYISGSSAAGALRIADGVDFSNSGSSRLALRPGDTGRIIQTGGRYTVGYSLYIAHGAGASGAYSLSAGDLTVQGALEAVGYAGQGTFTQTGGNNVLDGALALAHEAGATGEYFLAAGNLSASLAFIGLRGTGTFTQTGGTSKFRLDLNVGHHAGATGAYTLSAGDLTVAGNETIGRRGTGTFTQSGGTHTVDRSLTVGTGSVYRLTDGRLSVRDEYVGPSGAGRFQQAGGTNVVGYLSGGPAGRYELSGGTVEINDGFDFAGVLDLAEGKASVSANGIVDLTRVVPINGPGESLVVGPNSLLLLPPGLDLAQVFRHVSIAAMVHAAGQPLVVGPTQGFGGHGRINDFVETTGTIKAPAERSITLGGGVMVTAGSVDLGLGALEVDVPNAGIRDGQLLTWHTYVGYAGNGVFTQTGGTHDVTQRLDLGYSAGSTGTYLLSAGELTVGIPHGDCGDECIGVLGTGRFVQTGGTHTVNRQFWLGGQASEYVLEAGTFVGAGSEQIGSSGTGTFTQRGGTHHHEGLILGFNAASTGVYALSGGTLYSNRHECIGWGGTGRFIQAGGNNDLRAGSLDIGCHAGSAGEYLLSAGELACYTEEIGGHGTGTFTQTGGTHSVSTSISVGRWEDGQGTLTLGGGSVTARQLLVGFDPSFEQRMINGTLDLAARQAYLAVYSGLTLGPKATLRAVDGAVVHMKYSTAAFKNYGTDEALLEGLEHLTVIFEGGTAGWATFEAASKDMKTEAAGFLANFALDSLFVGGASAAKLRLVDSGDNGNRPSPEALYLHDLTVGPRSTLDLNGLNLYYDGSFVNQGTILGGSPIFVPEPATLSLVALGGLLILRRVRARIRNPK